MNKKVLIASLLALFVFSSFVGWFLLREQKMGEESPKPPVVGEKSQVSSQPSSESQSQTSLQEGMVWYEIPELGIQFGATPDTKKDLKYVFDEYKAYKAGEAINVKSVILYSSSQTNDQFDGCTVNEETGSNCGRIWINLYKNSDLYKNSEEGEWMSEHGSEYCATANGIKIYDNQKQTVCLFGSKSLSDEEYREFSGIHKASPEKRYGISLDSFLFSEKN